MYLNGTADDLLGKRDLFLLSVPAALLLKYMEPVSVKYRIRRVMKDNFTKRAGSAERGKGIGVLYRL